MKFTIADRLSPQQRKALEYLAAVLQDNQRIALAERQPVTIDAATIHDQR